LFQRVLCLTLIAVPGFAGEYVILSSGLRLHVDRHESSGQMVRLFTSADSFSEVPASAVSSFEAEDYVAPPVPPVVEPVAPTITPAASTDPKTMVHDAAIRYGLPPKFVESVAKVESAMRPDAVSPKGAIGVMQLMPATAKALDADPHDSAQNIEAGTKLLRELLIKYNNDAVKALAAYNAGEGAVDKFGGLPPYAETQSYVDKVLKSFKAADK
jgi:soluble lytic murein transglycosylase-like protein